MTSRAMEISKARCRPVSLPRAPAASDPNSATPIRLPVWRAVFRVPDAMPDRERSTPPSNVEVMTGTMSPRTKPRITSGATSAT